MQLFKMLSCVELGPVSNNRRNTMDAHFLTYVADLVDGQFKGEERRTFLSALRDNPERVTRFVWGNIENWNLWCEAANKNGAGTETDLAADPPLIVEHFKRHFAKEIEALSVSPQPA